MGTHTRYPPESRTAAYRLAGRTLCASPPLPDLEPFADDPPVASVPLPPPRPSEAGATVHRGEVWLGGGLRTIDCRRGPDGFRLSVAGAGELLVTADGGRIAQIAGDVEATPLIAETAVGPGLVLALALQDVWCLHAGGATFDGRAIALVGESGAGKSTLAAALGRRGGLWRLLADDLLPVAIDGGRPVALPRFPQARIPTAAQPGAEHPERLELAAVVLLAPPPADGRLALEPVDPRRAVLALVHHTFASCLFDRERLARHLDACAGLADRVPVRNLVYPRRRSALSAVGDLLEASLL
jgi:hypothetical protein